MPGMPDPIANEREGLLSFLAQQRYVLRLAAYGLTDDEARATPTTSPLSVGGLIKHVASMERSWMDSVVQRPPTGTPSDYEVGFRLGPDETLRSTIDGYETVAAETEAIIAAIADLGQPVPVPDAPWFPRDVEAWSVRFVLFHLIQETARHAGHADIVREASDGATAYPLMAAAEGWPATPWIQPWARVDASASPRSR